MARLSSLSASNARPRTPPRGGSGEMPPLTKTISNVSSPPRRNYTDYLSHTNDDWAAEDDDDEDDYGYDIDDGDEFGLPSISNMKRKTKRNTEAEKVDTSNRSPFDSGSVFGSSGLGTRRYSNSADIAIERPAPSYPIPKKSEGKILRPQYKEILRGIIRLQ